MDAIALLEEAKTLLQEGSKKTGVQNKWDFVKKSVADIQTPVSSTPRKGRLSCEDLEKIKQLKIRERNLEGIIERCEGELKAFRRKELDFTRAQISRLLSGNN